MKVCRAKAAKEWSSVNEHRKPRPQQNNFVEDSELALNDQAYHLYTMNDTSNEPIVVDVFMNNLPIKMELDSYRCFTFSY